MTIHNCHVMIVSRDLVNAERLRSFDQALPACRGSVCMLKAVCFVPPRFSFGYSIEGEEGEN